MINVKNKANYTFYVHPMNSLNHNTRVTTNHLKQRLFGVRENNVATTVCV